MSLRRLSLRTQLVLIALVGMLPLVLGIAFVIIPQMSQTLLETRKEQTKIAVEVLQRDLDELVAAEKSGRLSKAEAQAQAKMLIRTSKYNGTDYFFAYDFQGYNVAHGMNADREGKPFLESKDSQGHALLLRWWNSPKPKDKVMSPISPRR